MKAVLDIIRDELTSHHLFRADPDVREDSSLSDLGVDDLDRVAIAMRLEERFGIEVSDKAERSWATVSDVVAMVTARIAQNNPGEPVS